MKLHCSKIKILSKENGQYKIRFLDEDLTMTLDAALVDLKIKNGFYEVVRGPSPKLAV